MRSLEVDSLFRLVLISWLLFSHSLCEGSGVWDSTNLFHRVHLFQLWGYPSFCVGAIYRLWSRVIVLSYRLLQQRRRMVSMLGWPAVKECSHGNICSQ